MFHFSFPLFQVFKRAGRERPPGGRLWRARDGSIVPTFALLMPVVLIACGLGVDGAYYIDSKRKVDAALDAAALAATSDLRKILLAAGTSSPSSASSSAEVSRRAGTLFNANLSAASRFAVDNVTTDLSVSGPIITANFSYRATYRPFVMRVTGRDAVQFAGRSTVKASVLPYVEVTLLVDTSVSMAIGVDASAQDRLRATTGCAFACHDGAPFQGYEDTFAFAQAKGIVTRYDAVIQALSALIDKFDRIDAGASYIKASIVTFDLAFQQRQGMTLSRALLRSGIPRTPAVYTDEHAGATRFNEGISSLVNGLGKSGDGSSPAKPIKMVILATDGVQDPGRYWTWDLPVRDKVDVIDTSFCTTLKSKGVRIGIVHTPYVPMTYDWGYLATLGQPSTRGGPATRADDVAPALQTCAGADYHVADDKQSIIDGFQTLFARLLVPQLVNRRAPPSPACFRETAPGAALNSACPRIQ